MAPLPTSSDSHRSSRLFPFLKSLLYSVPNSSRYLLGTSRPLDLEKHLGYLKIFTLPPFLQTQSPVSSSAPRQNTYSRLSSHLVPISRVLSRSWWNPLLNSILWVPQQLSTILYPFISVHSQYLETHSTHNPQWPPLSRSQENFLPSNTE